MKNTTLLLAAIAWLAVSATANADVSATVTGITDYDFRGVSQTADDPALQASIDFEGESGFYAGIWGSNVDFDNCCDEDIEIDYYAGLTAGEFLEWDFGAIYYTYPGAEGELDYPEIYLGATYYGDDETWDLGLKQWGSWDWFGYDEYGYYTEANFNYALPWWGLGITAHYGYSWGDAVDGNTFDSGIEEYADYWIGINKSVWHLDLELRYVDTDLSGCIERDNVTNACTFDLEVGSGAGTNDDRVIFSVSTTFPWE